MGFLTVKGKVLTYEQYKERIEQYKRHGLLQFLSVYDAHKDHNIELDSLKWGEEMEYQIYFCDDHKQIKLSNRGPELIDAFNESNNGEYDIMLMPEFGGWMVEAVPKQPYMSISDANILLSSMDKLKSRRNVLHKYFSDQNLMILSMPNAPSLGTKEHIVIEDETIAQQVKENQDNLESINEASRSKFVVDKTINTHPRFAGLVKSIRQRRGEKVDIRVPLFHDVNTNMTEPTQSEPYPGEIYMDAMHFGMGQSCLQITYECSTINHARYLYDQLIPFTGIMAALSASGPIQKGKLSDYDLRWTVIEQSVDCRNAEERNPTSVNFIPKSRYSTVNNYISNHEYVKDCHNDAVPINYKEEHKQLLQQKGKLDDRLAEHVARLFARDPVPSYEGEFMEEQIDDSDLVSHFENLQSTNWNSLRFKPPPSQNSKIGWRVEFRTMDIQITDFENTCLIVMVGLIVNVINHFDVDFIMPVTMADENMDRAHYRDGVLNQKFWFKTNVTKRQDYHISELQQSDYTQSSKNSNTEKDKSQDEQKYEQLYIHEILAGKEEIGFVGLIPLIRKFMEVKNYSDFNKEQIEQILDFIMARAKGEIPTGARFIREFVKNHHLYKQDSIISPCLNSHLIRQILRMHFEPCKCEQETDSESHSSLVKLPEEEEEEENKLTKVKIDEIENINNQIQGQQVEEEKKESQKSKCQREQFNGQMSKNEARSKLLGKLWQNEDSNLWQNYKQEKTAEGNEESQEQQLDKATVNTKQIQS